MKFAPVVAVTAFLAGTAFAQPHSMTFEEALQQVRAGQGGEAIAVLQRLAEDDDVRAQLVLGAAMVEGTVVPVDRVQGYAWVQTAWLGYPGTTGWKAGQQAAREMVQKAELALSGKELIQGEQRGREFRERRTAEWNDAVARGREKLLGAYAAGSPLARVTETMARGKSTEISSGCALDPRRSRCTLFIRSKELAQARCDEAPVRKPTVPASTDPQSGARMEAPPLTRRPAVSCGVLFQAHVDPHGYVCSVAVIDGCGHAELERHIVDTVGRWRFTPASLDGRPVASLHTAAVTILR